MLWKDILENWKEGHFCYPSHIVKRFFYETSPITKDKNDIYEENFIETNSFDNLKQDYSPFLEHIENSSNDYAVSFLNISNDTILIVPMPRKDKNFLTIKDFIDNASQEQQTFFWKLVYESINIFFECNDKLYVSTHGLGVHYFHLRICNKPKYYLTKKFIKK